MATIQRTGFCASVGYYVNKGLELPGTLWRLIASVANAIFGFFASFFSGTQRNEATTPAFLEKDQPRPKTLMVEVPRADRLYTKEETVHKLTKALTFLNEIAKPDSGVEQVLKVCAEVNSQNHSRNETVQDVRLSDMLQGYPNLRQAYEAGKMGSGSYDLITVFSALVNKLDDGEAAGVVIEGRKEEAAENSFLCLFSAKNEAGFHMYYPHSKSDDHAFYDKDQISAQLTAYPPCAALTAYFFVFIPN